MLTVGVLGTLAGVGTQAAFFSTTANGSDNFAAGTVYLTDNDSGAAMLSLSNATPGSSDTSCIRVRFDGSLDSTVRLYATVSGNLAQYLNLVVTRGTDSS